MDLDTTPSPRPQLYRGRHQALLVSGRAGSGFLHGPGGTPQPSPRPSSHTITDPLTWSVLGFRGPTHLVSFTLTLAGALGIHPKVGVHVVGADARMGIPDGWQR